MHFWILINLISNFSGPLNIYDCNYFRLEELFDLNPSIIHAEIINLESEDTGEKIYNLKIKKNFKGEKITKLKVKGVDLALETGDEIIYLGQSKDMLGFYYYSIWGPPCVTDLVIKRKNKNYKGMNRKTSKWKFSLILKLLSTKQKYNPTNELTGFLSSDPFSRGNLISLPRGNEIKKKSKLILLKVTINKNGKIKDFKFLTKTSKKIRFRIEENILNCKWKFLNSKKEFTTIYPLVYSPNTNYQFNDF